MITPAETGSSWPRSPAPIKHSKLERNIKDPILFAVLTAVVSLLYCWPRRWLISGAPLLQLFILLGARQGYRVLPSLHLWPLFTTLHLAYAICSTSWLLYWVFTAICYPACFLVCLFQFEIIGNIARKILRRVLKQLHFIEDKIAFFDIPALEIDTEVDGLMVLRGITFSLSTLSFVVHGVEVGVKLSDDMELAIQTETIQVKLFRGIDIGDCFANLKGGKYEMTFGSLEGSTRDVDGDAVFVEDTPLLKAALKEGDTRSLSSVEVETVKMMDQLTDGSPPEDKSAEEGLKSMKAMSPDNEEASGRYQMTLDFIEETNPIHDAQQFVKQATRNHEKIFDETDSNAIRAAICSQLHPKPSVPHPPQRSIKVTTLQNLSPPYVRRFLHRIPMLLRVLLNPLSYFHPVHISSITATASGRWIDTMLVENIFHDYATQDNEIASLKKRISSWLSDANFAVSLAGIRGIASVPFLPTYDIQCQLDFNDVMSYRALPAQLDLKQVIRLGGADATFIVPSFLLPHHEHLLPAIPSEKEEQKLESKVDESDGLPKEIQAKHELKQAKKDEANVKLSVHARLPACFDQELLDFIAALVKATKVVEMEKDKEAAREESEREEEEGGNKILGFGRRVRGGLKDGVKRTVVGGVVNDRWIARMLGKITKRLETARGEVGYSGDFPVGLEVYRNLGWEKREGEKLLP